MLVALPAASTDVEDAAMLKERIANTNEYLDKVMYRFGVRYVQLNEYKIKCVRKAESLS